MCSYNITLNDTLLEKVKTSFSDDKALTLWLQQQVEELLLNYFLRHESLSNHQTEEHSIPDIVLSLLGSGEPLADDDLNGRRAYYHYLEEKYK